MPAADQACCLSSTHAAEEMVEDLLQRPREGFGGFHAGEGSQRCVESPVTHLPFDPGGGHALDEGALGVPRAEFLKALEAEGVPASEGWYQPLYRNGVFANAHVGPRHGIQAPLAGMGVDYRRVFCPECEQVCRDAVWIPQNVLLAEEHKIRSLADAIRKVAKNARTNDTEIG